MNSIFSELIRNQTLKFLSKTLPVLKADDTLPKVTQIPEDESVDVLENNGWVEHEKLFIILGIK